MSAPSEMNDVVRLAKAGNPFEAHLWEQALAEVGIRSQVVGDFLEAGLGDIAGAYPEIWVHRDDLARAKEILRQGQAVSGEEAVGEEPEA